MLTGNSLRELTSTEFAWKRMKRHDEAWAEAWGGDNVSHVVWCELSNSNLVELDANDSNHAIRLIESWLKSDDCITASYRTVNKDGTLGKCIRIFDNFKDYLEDDFFEGEYA